MKRKHTLLLTLLSVVVTALSGLAPFFKRGCCEATIDKLFLYGRGYPLPYYLYQTVWNASTDFPKINYSILVIDFLLWFIILTGGWLLIKKVKGKDRKS